MASHDLSPVSVLKYEKDHIVDLVGHKTGWGQRSEVFNKAQIGYIDQYLTAQGIDAQTLIVEFDYIDRHYIEDYSEYYARCFPSHPRSCSRLHFFKEKFDEAAFLQAVRANDEVFIETLQASYIGFAVIRPIPKTCFAKLCFSPYAYTHDEGDRKIIKTDISVTLFGISLTVSAAPFLEQDKVVSACATSAIWTLLAASKSSMDDIPSPSAITKSAYDATADGLRTFPNYGLTAAQVARSLKYFDLEPTVVYRSISGEDQKPTYEDKAQFAKLLKEHVYSYVSNGTPVILGGEVYEIENGKCKQLGRHLVCALGFNIDKEDSARKASEQVRNYAHSIDKLYVHDDRYGPYIRLEDTERDPNLPHFLPGPGYFLRILDKNETVTREEVFIPDVLIIGLYHKIRIPYEHVFKLHSAFLSYVTTSIESIQDLVKRGKEKGDAGADLQSYEADVEKLKAFVTGDFQITLVNNAKVKRDILRLYPSDEFSFDGDTDKTSLLLKSLPKYMWRCRTLVQGKLHSDLLIDATEVPQGRVILGIISYSLDAGRSRLLIEEMVSDGLWDQIKPNTEIEKDYIGGFLRFFDDIQGRSTLSLMYGPLKLAKRGLKLGETDASHNVTKRADVTRVRRGGRSDYWAHLNKAIKYIWAIDEEGDLLIGEDKFVSGKSQGHPTLTNGKPARVGGELEFKNETWLVNLRSRAYPSGITPYTDAWHKLLDTIIKHNLDGVTPLRKEMPDDGGVDEAGTF